MRPAAPRQRRQDLLARDPPPGDEQRQAEQHAGHDAGDEQPRDRHVGGDAEHDEADRRRNHRRDDAARGDQPRRARDVVAGLAHHRDQDRRQRRRVGRRRARQRRHDDRGDDRDVAEAAVAVADQRQREIDDPLGQPAGVHQLAGEQEERDRQQHERVGAVEDLLRDDLAVVDAEVRHQRDAADDQRERDRHADRHGAHQRHEEDGDGHRDSGSSCRLAHSSPRLMCTASSSSNVPAKIASSCSLTLPVNARSRRISTIRPIATLVK